MLNNIHSNISRLVSILIKLDLNGVENFIKKGKCSCNISIRTVVSILSYSFFLLSWKDNGVGSVPKYSGRAGVTARLLSREKMAA
jgi:hypothetical protein